MQASRSSQVLYSALLAALLNSFSSSQVARLLCVEGPGQVVVVLSSPVRVGDLARRSGLSLRRCSEFSNSILVDVVVGVMIKWSNKEKVIISTTILQMCATLQLCSALLFVVTMTMVMVNNKKELNLSLHHHNSYTQFSC